MTDDTARAALKPCPFCGSTDIDPTGVASMMPGSDKIAYSPACMNCDASTGGDWNARADAQKSPWIKTTDRLPEKPGKERYEYVDCLIFYKGEVIKRPWNCEHLCWDDEQYDDFFAHPTGPTHWMLLPRGPIDAERAAKEGEQ